MASKKHTPSVQQRAFLEELRYGTGHVALVARAGCGKTSTILMGVDTLVEMDAQLEILACAFNKAIAEEMKQKLRDAGHTDWRKVEAATLHSKGWGLVKFFFRLSNDAIDDKKVQKIIDAMKLDANDPDGAYFYDTYGSQITQLVRLAKGAGFGFFSDCQIGDAHAWYELADHYGVNGLDDTSEADEIVARAQYVYKASLAQTNVVDFDDMILFPLVKNMRVRFDKDVILLDEAQDLSRARQALAREFLKPGGRMIVVGDDRQAIYGFSGADSAAMPNLIQSLRAKTMPLSVTYRCPKAVVRLAQTLVPDITAHEDAPEGVVRRLGEGLSADDYAKVYDDYADSLTPDDAILCRNTAPLITMAYSLIRRGKPCKVEGRAIGEGLISLAKRWKNARTVSSLIDRLQEYKAREIQKAIAKGNEAKAEEVDDKVTTLLEICDACIHQGQQSIGDVISFIDSLFADGATNVTILATYHRSKGREWPRVTLFEHVQRCPSRAARQDWQIEQEHNLAYVAFTRAQQELVFI